LHRLTIFRDTFIDIFETRLLTIHWTTCIHHSSNRLLIVYAINTVTVRTYVHWQIIDQVRVPFVTLNEIPPATYDVTEMWYVISSRCDVRYDRSSHGLSGTDKFSQTPPAFFSVLDLNCMVCMYMICFGALGIIVFHCGKIPRSTLLLCLAPNKQHPLS
jgi:hypothetical protein